VKTAVILLAAGAGKRFGQKKQWVKIGKKPLISYSLSAFEINPYIDAIFVGVDKEDFEKAEEILKEFAPLKGKKVFIGGKRRQDTVFNGLKTIPEEYKLLGIHDAARPFVSQDLIERVIKTAIEKKAAIPVIPLRDTVKQMHLNKVVRTLQRESLVAVQTPQFFHRDLIIKAYEEGAKKGLYATDDAAFVEDLGFDVYTVEGEESNFKVTYPEDIKRLEREMGWDIRVGFGYDVHPCVKYRALILGGVKIEHEMGLAGYSDADVLSHAICDALIGALGIGDIGEHFPDYDPKNKARSSLEFLLEIGKFLNSKGWQIVNIDATVVMQRPKISKYKDKMASNISKALGISKEKVNIKATTTEGLGFTGREEGVAAYAVGIIFR